MTGKTTPDVARQLMRDGFGHDEAYRRARLLAAGDHPPGVTPLHHLWLPYRAGVPGSRICKWCGLTQRPDEQGNTQ